MAEIVKTTTLSITIPIEELLDFVRTSTKLKLPDNAIVFLPAGKREVVITWMETESSQPTDLVTQDSQLSAKLQEQMSSIEPDAPSPARPESSLMTSSVEPEPNEEKSTSQT